MLIAAFVALLAATQPSPDIVAKVDAVFAAYAKPDTPGCAVGVARGGQIVLERGYGFANLEYDAPITPETIFEAGSVTKQFTALAVLLLAEDGRLSLDDPVRKYIPELDPSASAVTIRQMLSHTSGLRDWGTVVGVAGWRRGTRLFTHSHVLQVLAKQHALNFPPGTQWSYSNSGYNLAAMLVERVSGKSFPDFTRERIFTPLGMTRSSWRDDYTRVVKGRATAYDPARSGYTSDMDIENIYGNCCLMTTVGDLLRWNENFRTATVGKAATLQAMQTPAVLANGQKLDYGLGLFIRDEPGKREVFHGGATAGYRAFLTRRIDDDLSIAVLCNRGDAGTGGFVDRVAKAFVPPPATPETPKKPVESMLAGLYRDSKTNAILRVSVRDDALRFGLRPGNGAALEQIAPGRYKAGLNGEIRFDDAGLHLMSGHKPEAVYVRTAEATPKLEEYAGTYHSDEADATYEVAIEGGKLMAKLAPVRSGALTPTFTDGFVSESGDLVTFTRDAKGRVDGFDAKADFSAIEGSARVERLHFSRLSAAATR